MAISAAAWEDGPFRFGDTGVTKTIVGGHEASEMHTVCLYEAVGTGLIVLRKTGIAYLNQAGGTSCLQRTEEGIFVPIGNDCEVPSLRLMSLEESLNRYFVGPPHEGTGAANGLTDADADVIDDILRTSSYFSGITVDRARLNDSCEAWIYVAISAENTVGFDGLGPNFPEHAVLTWVNSD